MNSVDRTDTMRRARILRWASLSAALAACAATLAAVSLTGWSLFQPDTRYMVAIGETGADFAVFPSGAYSALEKALTGLGYADIYDDGCFAAYADRPVP